MFSFWCYFPFSAPEHFSSSLLSKIEFECGSSWFLRVSNLRRIYLSIVDFYSEVLDRTIPEKLQPDLEAIARDNDIKHLGYLLQLILGCAINCIDKEKHIEVMTTLSLEVKQGLKMAIDELENFEENHSHENALSVDNDCTNNKIYSQEYNELQQELTLAKLAKETISQRCHELEITVSKLNNEKLNLKIENEKLSDKLSQSSKSNTLQESTLRFDSIEQETFFQRLNNQISTLQSQLTVMEEQKEDYRTNLEVKEKEYKKSMLQIDQLQTKLNEFKNHRDDLDRLDYLNDEIIKYQNINEVQKKKLEELQELKKQIKLLEDRNASLIKQTCELEEEKKSMSVYKGQLELIKKQRDDLRTKASEENFRADKAEDELKRTYKKYNDIVHEKEKLQMEVMNLKSEISNHRKQDSLITPSIDLDISSRITPANSNAITVAGSNMFKNDFGGNSTELNEKVIRLEFENAKLQKELQKSNDEKVKLLESQLEDEKVRLSKLEADNRINNQRIIELEGQLKENANTYSTITNNKDMLTLKSKLKELEQEKANLISLVDKKTEELAEKDERFKKHVNKAKETFELLETHMNNSKISNSLPDTSKVQSDDAAYWRNLANHKDIEIEKLKTDYDKSIIFRDMEERLMTIGFHNLVCFVSGFHNFT